MITIYKDLKQQYFIQLTNEESINIPDEDCYFTDCNDKINTLILLPTTLYNHLINKNKIYAIQNLQSNNVIQSIISKAIINNSIINQISLTNPNNQPRTKYNYILYKPLNHIVTTITIISNH